MLLRSPVRKVTTAVLEMARWWVVMPVAIWWASIFILQMLNPWLFQPAFGFSVAVLDLPDNVWQEARWLIAFVLVSELGNDGISLLKAYVKHLEKKELSPDAERKTN